MFDTLDDPFVNNSVNSENPLYSTHEHEVQYRLKIQRYSSLPCEITVQKVDYSPLYDKYSRAYENGYNSCFTRRGSTRDGSGTTAESIERSSRRAKIEARKLATELAPTALVTFTTRRIYSIPLLLQAWQRFVRSLHAAGVDFQYLAVPERHPSNPEHLHIHAAYRGHANIKLLRRLWHIALEAIEGRTVKKTLYRSDAPGNIDVRRVAAQSGYKRMRKIAKYIAKYITKDVIVQFNKKRYWPSKGIKLQPVAIVWLKSLTMPEALHEGLLLMGLINPDGQPCQHVFNPSDRIAWLAVDPEKIPDPLF